MINETRITSLFQGANWYQLVLLASIEIGLWIVSKIDWDKKFDQGRNILDNSKEDQLYHVREIQMNLYRFFVPVSFYMCRSNSIPNGSFRDIYGYVGTLGPILDFLWALCNLALENYGLNLLECCKNRYSFICCTPFIVVLFQAFVYGLTSLECCKN